MLKDMPTGRKFSTPTVLCDDSPLVPHPDRDLFLWCTLLGKSKLAKVFWRSTKHYAASALLASALIRGESELIDFNTQDSALADELHEASQQWTQTAIDFVAASFRERKQATLCMLTQRLALYGGCSTLHLSHATDSAEFIAQPASQSALDYIWIGRTKKDQPGWKKFLAILCPLLVPCLNAVDRTNHFLPTVSQVYQSTFTRGDDDDISQDHEAGLGAGVVYVMQTISKSVPAEGAFELPTKQLSKCASFSEDIFDYFNSPSIKFLVHSLFLFINMIILSLNLVIDYPPYFSLRSTNILSFVVLFYMIGITVDEFRQIMTIENKSSFKRRFASWASDKWNQADLVMVCSFYLGQFFTLFKEDGTYVIKIFYSITLLAMALRCFQAYLVFPFLGPKVYMMGRMMGDVRSFLSIMALIFFSYGVILEGLNQELNLESDENVTSVGTFFVFLYNRIFREPYWQIYGNALGTAADSKYTFKTIVPGVITAFYVLFSNLLMVNLLIAMFSYTFQAIQDNATLYWKFYRFEVVKEFWIRPWLPSPFIIVEDIVRVLQWFHNREENRNRAFNRPLTKEQEEYIAEFEQEVMTLMIEDEKKETEKADALHADVKKILAKLKERN